MNSRLLIILSILIGALLITSGVAIAFVITALTPEKVTVYSGTVVDSDFTLNSIDTKFKGPNKITITFNLVNGDSSSHSANVTVQLLNSLSDIIIDNAQLTGVITTSGVWVYSYTFSQSGVTATYTSTYIIVDQLT